jgi:hypothetical protein
VLIDHQAQEAWNRDVARHVQEDIAQARALQVLAIELLKRWVRAQFHTWQWQPVEPGNHEGVAFHHLTDAAHEGLG